MSAHTPEEPVVWCRQTLAGDARAFGALAVFLVGGAGGVNTLVETSDGAFVLPNGLLLESALKSPKGPAEPSGE